MYKGRRKKVLRYVIALPFVAFLVVFTLGMISGRIRARNCCGTANPEQDLRMRSMTHSHRR
ncbi:MAG: hypothetical protein ABI586_10845 [Candidatus Nanopelagicales bacterium]